MSNTYLILINHQWKVYHAVNENRGAEAVAPVEVLRIISSVTLACGSS